MERRITMYCFGQYEQRQINITQKLSERQSMNFGGIHWLNPLLHKCDKEFYPDSII